MYTPTYGGNGTECRSEFNLFIDGTENLNEDSSCTVKMSNVTDFYTHTYVLLEYQHAHSVLTDLHHNDPCIHFLHPAEDDSLLWGHGQYAYLFSPPDLPQQPLSLRWALANHWVVLGCNPQLCVGECAQWEQWWTVLWWAASLKLKLKIFIYMQVH